MLMFRYKSDVNMDTFRLQYIFKIVFLRGFTEIDTKII